MYLARMYGRAYHKLVNLVQESIVVLSKSILFYVRDIFVAATFLTCLMSSDPGAEDFHACRFHGIEQFKTL